MNHNRTDYLNPFRDFSPDELEDAYEYFSHIGDYRGCELVADVFCRKVKLNLANIGL